MSFVHTFVIKTNRNLPRNWKHFYLVDHTYAFCDKSKYLFIKKKKEEKLNVTI